MEKLCMFCENFQWAPCTEGGSGPGEYDYWDADGGASCKAGKFYDNRPRDEREFRELILQAKTCKSYTPPKKAKVKKGRIKK